MHARHPAMENTSMRNNTDRNGFAYIQAILNQSNQAKHGSITYEWSRSGNSDKVTKLAHFQNF